MAVAAALIAVLAIACAREKPVITVHDFDTESSKLSNAIFEFIVENGYGYQVESVIETSTAMQQNLASGDIDVNLEGWQQNALDWYEQETLKGSIVNLGMIYEGGPQFFVIPAWMAEEYGIRTIYDMKDHWSLFRDPEDPSKGVFFNCIVGWECSKINKVKLKAYGLTSYYNIKSPGSAEALKVALGRSQESRQPVFGYYWPPSDIMGAYDWYVLEEPEYTLECWVGITAADGDSDSGPDRACAYENVPVEKLANSNLPQKAPEVVEMLKKMVVGLAPINETLAWTVQNGVNDWQIAAVHYLQTHGERWEGWVTIDARERVNKALMESSS